MLDFCEMVLERAGFRVARLDGSLNQSQRDKMIRRFAEDPNTTVFLVSLKAGGVGLNLVAANYGEAFTCLPQRSAIFYTWKAR